MPDPRIFLLSGRATQEIPLSWLQPDPEHAIEVAPGVRVALMGCGDTILPGDVTAWGAQVAVWAEPGTVIEWEVRNGEHVMGGYGSDCTEDEMRGLARYWRHRGVPASLWQRKATPWAEVPETEPREDTSSA